MKAHSSLKQQASPTQLTIFHFPSALTCMVLILCSQQARAIASRNPPIAPASKPFPLSGNSLQGSGLTNSAYILGAGDQIDITVLGYQEFTGTKVILPDGTIALPVIGNMKAAGRSPSSLAQALSQQLRPFLKNPAVTIGVLSMRPLPINVAGEINRPRPIQLQSFNVTQPSSGTAPRALPTVSSALLAAGGLTQNADLRQVVLRRMMPTGETVTTKINLWKARRSRGVSQ